MSDQTDSSLHDFRYTFVDLKWMCKNCGLVVHSATYVQPEYKKFDFDGVSYTCNEIMISKVIGE